jgi:hypothetical protein
MYRANFCAGLFIIVSYFAYEVVAWLWVAAAFLAGKAVPFIIGALTSSARACIVFLLDKRFQPTYAAGESLGLLTEVPEPFVDLVASFAMLADVVGFYYLFSASPKVDAQRIA